MYTQAAIVNNTKQSSPGKGKWSLKLVAIEIEPRPFFRTRSFRQSWRWKDARSETADISVKTLELFKIMVRTTLRCLDITCLCILSFLLKDFSQAEQNQLMSTPQEQNVDWERGRMLRIYIGFQDIKFYCFPPPPPPAPPPHFSCFPSTTTNTTTFQLFSSTTTTTTFLSFSLHHHHHISLVSYSSPIHFIFFFHEIL